MDDDSKDEYYFVSTLNKEEKEAFEKMNDYKKGEYKFGKSLSAD